MAEAATTRDAVLGGKLALEQPVRGHRAGTDAVLLAATLGAGEGRGATVLDLGCGVGTVGLIAARLWGQARVTCVDIDADSLDLTAENARLNGLSERVETVALDVLAGAAARRRAGLRDGVYDVVLTNPPFLDPSVARLSPDLDRRRAHAFTEDAPATNRLSVWVKSAAALLRPKGRLAIIHRADALAPLLAACEGRLGAIQVLPVHPHAAAPASRILVVATRGSRAPLSLLPALHLHEADGPGFTPRAERLHRGEETLALIAPP